MSDDLNFAATLTERARASPTQLALIEQHGGRITFAELDRLTNRFASGLARQGVRRGDRVLYMLRPSIEGYAVFYALLRRGAVPVLMDPRMGLRRLLESITSARPRVLLAVPLLHAVRTLMPRAFAGTEVLITAGPRWFWGGVRLVDCLALDDAFSNGSTALGDPSFLPFTSGSTGPPKGVFYNHAMLRQQVAVMREVCGWREGMRVVMAYAPFVSYALADGLTVILPTMDFSRPAAADPASLAAALNDYQAHCGFASPIVWMHLVRFATRHEIVFPALERAVTAGAPVPPDLHRRLRPLLHRTGQLYTPYGATEAMPLTTTGTTELTGTWELTRQGFGTCVGSPLSGVDISIIRVTDEAIPEWSQDLCVPEGAIGEVVVSCPFASPTYDARPDENARAKIRCSGQILHRMGDLGRRDGDGRLWFCGRKADRIETRGGMIPSVPLENVFNEHPAVFRTAVVGVGPAEDRAVVACVELEAGERFTPALGGELTALARGTCFEGVVSRFVPHRGFPVDARHNSKIRHDQLAEWAQRQCAQ